MKAEDLKLVVKEKYGAIAKQNVLSNQSSCCGNSGCCGELEFSMIGDEYANIEGHNPDADMGLGCGIPTEFAQIKKGDTVVDLGSGAGNDCFVARALAGENGKIIGIDMTESMIEKARENNQKLGYGNIEFCLGDIEDLPLADNTADVVISNCVLNLVPNKDKAFAEIYRILKPEAHLSVSDIVLKGELPEKLKQAAEMYVGCVSGAMQKDDYLKVISNSGLVNIKVQKEKPIDVPDSVLLNYLSPQELIEYKQSGIGIFSITVYAEK
ncbi:MAG: arsenite methyltransferase [Bacteroidales bacterium]|jgi:SAM-dependent methyltransferase|nr:arsenite methyltransferase [Bacteroidales bacterium]MDD3131637.1 arsenite methyltransferase [Bacteroidales bacterium]MDY0334664.1 arsenite methyltransferase [Bacteroidales bacterium]NLO52567.1 arsenite methyltransferase [Bacteroidales bacterium]